MQGNAGPDQADLWRGTEDEPRLTLVMGPGATRPGAAPRLPDNEPNGFTVRFLLRKATLNQKATTIRRVRS